MVKTFYFDFERDNGRDENFTEISVEYSVASWGCDAQVSGPAENCYPAEPIEIDVLSVDTPFGPFVLRDSEVGLVHQDAADRAGEAYYEPVDWERDE